MVTLMLWLSRALVMQGTAGSYPVPGVVLSNADLQGGTASSVAHSTSGKNKTREFPLLSHARTQLCFLLMIVVSNSRTEIKENQNNHKSLAS